MKKQVAEWTEDDVMSLPGGENDAFERKGTALLDLTLPGVKEAEVLNEMAKQLSAFANTAGGKIIYGVSNSGVVDRGGVSRCVKGRRSTKEWVEDLIPTLTDYEIVGCNVYEIQPGSPTSGIASDKSLFIVDIPNSERAPHQSNRDLKYYVRLGATSQPAPHRLVEDIRNRARHPKIEVEGIQISSATYGWSTVSSPSRLNLPLRWNVANNGAVRAANCCLLLASNVFLHENLAAWHGFSWRPAAAPGTMLMELEHPLYPSMATCLSTVLSVEALVAPAVEPDQSPLQISNRKPEDVTLSFTIYADSAPAHTQRFQLTDVLQKGALDQVIKQELNRQRR